MKIFVNKNWIVYKMSDKSKLDSCSRIAPKKLTGRNDKLFFPVIPAKAGIQKI